MISAETMHRVRELKIEGRRLYESLENRSLTRQNLLDEIWASERISINERNEFQKIMQEMDAIFDEVFKEVE